jgi:hypothetical protein
VAVAAMVGLAAGGCAGGGGAPARVASAHAHTAPIAASEPRTGLATGPNRKHATSRPLAPRPRRTKRRLPTRGPRLRFPHSHLVSLKHPQRCTNLAFPGPLLVINRVTDCWVALYRNGVDLLFFAGRNPQDHAQHTLIYARANGGSSIVGVPGTRARNRIASLALPEARMRYRGLARIETFNFTTGRFRRSPAPS